MFEKRQATIGSDLPSGMSYVRNSKETTIIPDREETNSPNMMIAETLRNERKNLGMSMGQRANSIQPG